MAAQKKLAKLKEWTHINCERDKEVALDYIEDEILKATAQASMDKINRATARQRQIQDSDDEDEQNDENGLSARKQFYTGGEITFVFHVGGCPLGGRTSN